MKNDWEGRRCPLSRGCVVSHHRCDAWRRSESRSALLSDLSIDEDTSGNAPDQFPGTKMHYCYLRSCAPASKKIWLRKHDELSYLARSGRVGSTRRMYSGTLLRRTAKSRLLSFDLQRFGSAAPMHNTHLRDVLCDQATARNEYTPAKCLRQTSHYIVLAHTPDCRHGKIATESRLGRGRSL